MGKPLALTATRLIFRGSMMSEMSAGYRETHTTLASAQKIRQRKLHQQNLSRLVFLMRARRGFPPTRTHGAVVAHGLGQDKSDVLSVLLNRDRFVSLCHYRYDLLTQRKGRQ